MKTAFYSVKGGSRCSTIAAAYALVAAEKGQTVALVDHGSDLPALLGLPQPYDLAYAPVEVVDNLVLVSAAYLADNPEAVQGLQVHDYGVVTVTPEADDRMLVIAPCYLAMRRAVTLNIRADGVVLMNEPGRALNAHDIERCLGITVCAEVPSDPVVARCIDAGLMSSRLPKNLRDAMSTLVNPFANQE